MQMIHLDSRPGAWQLLRIWTTIGLQSFGGGSSTIFLIQRNFIEKHGWLTMEDFTLLWTLCQFTPGINIIALTILIGRRLGGTWGIISSLVGLLLPSAAITCLLAAGFKAVEQVPAVQAIFRGVVPATAGIMLVVGLRFAQPLFKVAHKEGISFLIISGLIILACATSIIWLHLSVVPVLLCAALVGMAFFTPWRKPPPSNDAVVEGEK